MTEAEPGLHDPRPNVRRRDFGWGFIDQAFASLGTLGLTLAIAREVGPSGVGGVAVAYAAFVVALGIQRALLLEPYLTRTRTALVSDRRALGACFSLSVIGGLLASGAFFCIGLVTDGVIATAFTAFSVWVMPMLLQAFLRGAAFRHGRGSVAAVASAASVGAFALAVLASEPSPTVTRLIACWGFGGVVGLGVLIVAYRRFMLTTPLAAFRWWKSEAMEFGGWLLTGTLAWSILSYALIAGLVGIVGTAAVGGYRVIESVFSPLSLLSPALANPGFKAIRDGWANDPRDAMRIATRISITAMACIGVYAVCVGVGRNIVFSVYGSPFRTYADLIIPIAVGQTLIAGTVGFTTLLKAARRGRDAIIVGTGGAFCALVAGLTLARIGGITAAAWGIALAYAPSLIWAIVASRAAIKTNAPTGPATQERVTGEASEPEASIAR